MQTIKSVARRRWVGDDGPRASWYEPLRDGAAVGRAVQFVLSRRQLFLNTSSDPALLRPILEAASSIGAAPDDDEMQADMEAFAMQPLFDGAELERI